MILVWRQWKRDGAMHQMPMSQAIERLVANAGLEEREVEGKLIVGEILETRTARFCTDREKLGSSR